MPKPNQANPRVTLSLTKQYPLGSLNAKRYQALREYYGNDLKKMMEQAIWAVLGPIGSALSQMPPEQVQGQVGAAKDLVQALHFEALDQSGGDWGEVLGTEPDLHSEGEPGAEPDLEFGADPLLDIL